MEALCFSLQVSAFSLQKPKGNGDEGRCRQDADPPDPKPEDRKAMMLTTGRDAESAGVAVRATKPKSATGHPGLATVTVISLASNQIRPQTAVLTPFDMLAFYHHG
jgi:hypothetical protein